MRKRRGKEYIRWTEYRERQSECFSFFLSCLGSAVVSKAYVGDDHHQRGKYEDAQQGGGGKEGVENRVFRNVKGRQSEYHSERGGLCENRARPGQRVDKTRRVRKGEEGKA